MPIFRAALSKFEFGSGYPWPSGMFGIGFERQSTNPAPGRSRRVVQFMVQQSPDQVNGASRYNPGV